MLLQSNIFSRKQKFYLCNKIYKIILFYKVVLPNTYNLNNYFISSKFIN